MLRRLEMLSTTRYDLLVVGGGICGLMAAYDAAQRGLSVALVERDDFGSGSSFNNLRTVHGGLRSLQSLDLARARESIAERRALARIAPHLLHPQPFLIATSHRLTRSQLAMRSAFLIDGLVARDRNDGVETALHLPEGRVVSREVCLKLFPGVRREGLTGGAMWYDYQMRCVERLNVAVAEAASAHGAHLVNHVEAIDVTRTGNRVTGMRVRDGLSDRTVEIAATVTLNAAGSGVPGMLAAFGARPDVPLLKATNVVTSRPAGDVALGASTREGRMLIMLPSNGRAIFGTSHSSSIMRPDQGEVSSQELEAFLSEINDAFPELRLRRDEITLVHRGLVPAAPGGAAPNLSSRIDVRDHAREGAEGAVSVLTPKYTIARRAAEIVVDRVFEKLGRPAVRSRTAETPLPGAEIADFDAAVREAAGGSSSALDVPVQKHLIARYGSRVGEVLRLVADRPEWGAAVAPGVPVLRAEIIHAVREEMACTLRDAVVRRTGLGAFGYPGELAAHTCAALLASELDWSDARVEQELDELRRFYLPVGPLATADVISATAPGTR